MLTIDSRLHFNFGFPTIRRRRHCSACGFRATTIEIPYDIAEEIFKEDE